MLVAMLNDTSKCTACKGCQVACKQWNDLPAEATKNVGSYQNPMDLSFVTLTHVRFLEANIDGRPCWLFRKHQCFHCTDAVCVQICPTGALKSNSLGFVSYEQSLCSGCGYCLRHCPFDIPKQDSSVLSGKGAISKCHFCQDRTTNGLAPACAKACPSKAISYGERDEIVVLGKQRVEIARSKGYTDANLYGETELGGLGVMYVLLDKPSTYGLPDNPFYNTSLVDIWSGMRRVWQVAVGSVKTGSRLHRVDRKGKDPVLTLNDEEKRKALT